MFITFDLKGNKYTFKTSNADSEGAVSHFIGRLLLKQRILCARNYWGMGHCKGKQATDHRTIIQTRAA